MQRAWIAVGVVLAVGLLAGVEAGKNGAPAPEVLACPVPTSGLENLLKLNGDLLSGSQPVSEDDFQALKEMGVKTIVSVDAARPDLEKAYARGMKYVQIPIGYDGIEPEEAAQMARALHEREGPFYIHCHHGKHRGPAMAAVAFRLHSGIDTGTAIKVLETAGTSDEYAGLWRDVATLDAAKIAGIEAPLYEVAPVEDMAAGMAGVDRTFDNLKLIELSNWQTPPDHADLDPAHEALLLEEGFKVLLEQEHEDLEAPLREGFEESAKTAAELKDALKEGNYVQAEEHFTAIKNQCKTCHAVHRN